MHVKLQALGLFLLTLFVVPVFYISLAASGGISFEAYDVTFSQAYEEARATSWREVREDDFAKVFLWFIPFAILVSLAFVWLRKRRISNHLLILAILVPALLSPFSLAVGIALPGYLLFPQDGETWGEAWPALSAMGFWIFGVALLAIYRWKTWEGNSKELGAG